jgi:hypothetical protein
MDHETWSNAVSTAQKPPGDPAALDKLPVYGPMVPGVYLIIDNSDQWTMKHGPRPLGTAWRPINIR